MANLLISCINRTNKIDPDQRILYVGGVYEQQRWKHSLNDAIFHMEMTIHAYHMECDGEKIAVKIASSNGNKYLKSIKDDMQPDDLLALPECPH